MHQLTVIGSRHFYGPGTPLLYGSAPVQPWWLPPPPWSSVVSWWVWTKTAVVLPGLTPCSQSGQNPTPLCAADWRWYGLTQSLPATATCADGDFWLLRNWSEESFSSSTRCASFCVYPRLMDFKGSSNMFRLKRQASEKQCLTCWFFFSSRSCCVCLKGSLRKHVLSFSLLFLLLLICSTQVG